MGRYYTGDIEGKFWFAVQDSDDADFFGSTGQASHLNYYFNQDNLKDIAKGIEVCKKELGEWKQKLDDFFKNKNCYGDNELTDQLGLKKDDQLPLLQWYARLELGEQIHECVVKNGSCGFEAEI
jgi:hypothetical protein